MKKVLYIALLTVCTVFMANVSKAQSKIGYANFNAIVDAMPAKAELITTMTAYQKTFADQAQTMQNNYQAKLKIYVDGKAKMADAERMQAESELTSLQKGMDTYNTQAQQQIEARQQQLAKPILDNVMTAVKTVGKEKGYSYIFDSSQQIMLMSPEGDDLTAAVKLKLGIK